MWNPFDKNKRFLRLAKTVDKADKIIEMIDKGQDPNVTDDDGRNILHLMAFNHALVSKENLDRFIKAGANINAQTAYVKRTPLMSAIIRQDSLLTRLLMEQGADLNIADADGKTAISHALTHYESMLSDLIKAGADFKSIGADGLSLLSWAAYKGKYSLVKTLIENGVNINETDPKTGWSALHYAAMHNNPETMRILVMAGADMNQKAEKDNNRTPLHVAYQFSQNGNAAYLLERGADYSINIGKTPLLLYAAHKGYFYHTDIMISRGADTSITDKDGHTVQYYQDQEKIKSTPPPPPPPPPRIIWTKNDDERVTRTELEPALGKKLSDTFNFTRRERLSAVINPADGKVETITISSFDQMPDKAILEEALHEFTNQGGAVDPAVIHHRASQRNKRPLI